MSGAVATAPRARLRSLPLEEIGPRLVVFGALAAFCLAHYAALVRPSGASHLPLLLLTALVAGWALEATRPLSGWRAALARSAILAVLSVLALVATGVSAKLLLPGHWSDLHDGLSRGFAGLNSFTWPYDQGDKWIRLTLLLAMPLLLVPATALAFWPARRAERTLRALATAPLLIAYGMGVTDLEMGGWAVRGIAILLLLAGYLWLPSLRGRDMRAAAIVVGACGVAAIPLGAGLDTQRPWLDYRHWNWFSAKVAGTTFAWDHSYGPMTWSRTGTKLLAIRSKEPHYWKAETLDRFDGLRWIHSESSFAGGSGAGDIPQPIHQQWNEQIQVSLRHLSTKVVIGAGTVYRVDSQHATAAESDGTVKILDSPMQEGESYKVYAYVPDPTAAQMRAAPRAYPDGLASYTYFDLPAGGQSGLRRAPVSATERVEFVTDHTVQPIAPNQPLTALDRARVQASPYGRVYDLAQRLAANKPTTYDVVRAIETHLQRGYEYSEKPPARRYPLEAFLFRDKIGYCQQFSGAMALMLRMDGIPARVATGFSPGSFNHTTNEYEVRDLDAHSWVEVWFTGIGWVPFDPTPSLAPAGSQSSGNAATSAARGGNDRGASFRASNPESPSAAAGGAAGSGTRLWIVLLALGVLGSGAFAVLWLAGLVRARRHFPATEEGAVDELRAALARLGYGFPARTTLRELERRLRVTAGDPAARYVRLLRARRYGPPGEGRSPGKRDRRELRRALTAGAGPLTRLRGLVVLPPHPRRRAY